MQRAWIEEQVPQCGYCQPGFIMATAALFKDEAESDRPGHRRRADQHLPLRHLQRDPPCRASRGGYPGRRIVKWTRRKTIIAGVLGAGFVGVGWWFAHGRDRLGSRTLFNVKPGEAGLNGWVKIARDNTVT